MEPEEDECSRLDTMMTMSWKEVFGEYHACEHTHVASSSAREACPIYENSLVMLPLQGMQAGQRHS